MGACKDRTEQCLLLHFTAVPYRDKVKDAEIWKKLSDVLYRQTEKRSDWYE